MIWWTVGTICLITFWFTLWAIERHARKVAEREVASVRDAHQKRHGDYTAAIQSNTELEASYRSIYARLQAAVLRGDTLARERDALQAKVDELQNHAERMALAESLPQNGEYK